MKCKPFLFGLVALLTVAFCVQTPVFAKDAVEAMKKIKEMKIDEAAAGFIFTSFTFI